MRVLNTNWPHLMSSRGLSSDLFSEMDRFFSDVTQNAATAYDERDFSPASEVAETEEHYLMSVDLPGMKKEDIKIELNQNLLSISGERKRETEKDENKKLHFYEKRYGFFKKSFSLPNTVDAGKIEAHYENGVLELYLPKTVLAKPRQIEIQTDSKEGFFNRLLGGKKSPEELKDVASIKAQ